MAKPKGNLLPAEDADVAFNFAAGELRTEEIKLPGHKAFSITFRVPGAGASADLALAASGGSDDETASRGEAMVRYIVHHLVGWTIPRPASWNGDWPNAKAVDSIRDALVLLAIFSKVREAAAEVKN